MLGTESLTDLKQNQLYEQLFQSLDKRFGGETDFSHYQANPVSFGEEVLKESFTDDVKALMNSVRDYPITIAKSANATGKTHGAARVAVWFYKVFPESQVYTAAAPPEANLRKLLWGEIGSVLEKHPDVFKQDTVSNLQISRSARSFISGVTIPSTGSESQREAKFSGKHAPYLLFIIDEGDAVPDEVYRGIESCMSGGHARLLVMFNPRHQSGEVHRMERDGRANVVHLSAFSHPNVTTGKDVIPGAVTRETTVRRLNQWCRPLADNEAPSPGSCFELPSFLIGSTARSQSGDEYSPLKAGIYKVNDPAFSYMVLGEYPAQGSQQLISQVWITKARNRWDSYVSQYGEAPRPGETATGGLDVGEYGTDSSVLCFRYPGFVERLISWGGMDTMQTADRAAQEAKRRSVSVVNVDATGVGSGVAPAMQRQGCLANPVKVASSPTQTTDQGEFKILRDQLLWACREWLRTDPEATLPPDEELIEELLTPTYEIDKGKIRVMSKSTMRELLRRSPDRADALCLTFQAGGFFAGLDLS